MNNVISSNIYQYKYIYILNIFIFNILITSCQAVKENQVEPLAVKRSNNTTDTQQQHQQAEWMTVVERGNDVAKKKQWEKALRFYNKALDLMDNPIATPQAPSLIEIKKVLNLASQAQLLANNSNDGTRSILNCNTMMRSVVRGFQIKKHLIPVQFEYGKTTFNKEGKKSAGELAECLRQRQRNYALNKVELIGHTDEKGSYEFNDKLSLKRAEALRKYLKNEGITVDISTAGKGEKEPLQLENADNYTQAEIDELNRRVEVITI